jgi:hypothetical protein
MSEARGVFQSDLIIETAIRAGIADLRANPWLVPYIFRSLADDDLTAKQYGRKQIDAAVKWLLKTEIPVFVNARLDSSKVPSITINLINSSEADNTLADIHHDPTESVLETDDTYWPALTQPFTPVSWNPTVAELVVPTSITIDLFPGMKVIDRTGAQYSIEEVREDAQGRAVLVLPQGTQGNFAGSVVKSGSPPMLDLESAQFRESYLVGCHVVGEAFQLMVLHSALVFILCRYRQRFLEARGFEASAISSTDFAKNAAFQGDTTWSRYINIEGRVRNVWPKDRHQAIDGVLPALRIADAAKLPPDTDPQSALWIGDQDSLGGSRS